MSKLPNVSDHRQADHPIDPIFIHRWSPRAMTGEPISEAELHSLFEAARWAPSSFNEQPWRLLYARRDTPHFQTFFDLLVEGNKAWCGNAAVLIVFVSSKTFARSGKPNPVHVYDCGSAWENLALQGAKMGLVTHGMAGFDGDKARAALNVPEGFDVCAMAAVGRHGDPDKLPEALRAKEVPSGRKPVAEIALEGGFRST
jgi:nitroreductase